MRLALHFIALGHIWLVGFVILTYLGSKWMSLICLIWALLWLAVGGAMIFLKGTKPMTDSQVEKIVRSALE